jgi:hypothetical protein
MLRRHGFIVWKIFLYIKGLVRRMLLVTSPSVADVAAEIARLTRAWSTILTT